MVARKKVRVRRSLILVCIERLIVDRVLDFLTPVVAPGHMTARGAFSSVFILHIVGRKIPCSKRHGITDVFGIVARMDLMTGTAGPPFDGPVDVPKVEVLIAVSEVGQSSGIAVKGQGFLMAAEAEGIFIRGKGSIKLPGIFAFQQTEIIRSMRVMTSRAILLANRTMPIPISFKPLFHVYDLSVWGLQLLVVARQTEVGRGVLELLWKISVMRIMAVQAFLAYFVSVVLGP